jgi:hypothetical protein
VVRSGDRSSINWSGSGRNEDGNSRGYSGGYGDRGYVRGGRRGRGRDLGGQGASPELRRVEEEEVSEYGDAVEYV